MLSYLFISQASLKTFYQSGDAMIYFEYLANGLITLFIVFSTWLIVVMAAERYIAVCHPLQARKLISLKRTRACLFIVFIICAVSTIPIFLERRIEKVTCYDGSTAYMLVERSETFVRLRRILWATLFDFIPSAALIYFNLCLIIQIRKAKHLREQMTPKHAVMLYSPSGATLRVHRFKSKHNVLLKAQNTEQTPVNNSKESLLRLNYVKSGGKAKTRSPYGQQCNAKVNEYCKLDTFSNCLHNNPKLCSVVNNNQKDDMLELNELRTDQGVNSSVKFRVQGTRHVQQKRPSDSALNSVTATLVAVVLLFLLLVSPSEIMKFSVSYTSANKDQQMLVTYLTNFMQVLNFSLNFVLYCAVNKTFRQTLRGIACCFWLSLR